MRFYGGGPVGVGNAGVFNNATMGGIPVGEDPRFPMSQEQFREEMDKIKHQNIPSGALWERFREIHGPKLKGASSFPGDSTGAIGNAGGMIAQAFPGGRPPGNAAALGGMIEAGPRFGPRPLNLDINAVDNRLESIGGSANIKLNENQMLRFGGNFNPATVDEMGMQVPQGYQVYGAYETPGFGLNVNYRNTGGGRGLPGGPGQVQAGIKGRF